MGLLSREKERIEKEKFEKEKDKIENEKLKTVEEAKETMEHSESNEDESTMEEIHKPQTVIENLQFRTNLNSEEFSEENSECSIDKSMTLNVNIESNSSDVPVVSSINMNNFPR